jgi:hypothetical protein
MSVAELVVSILFGLVMAWLAWGQNALQKRMLALENAREAERVKQARSAHVTASVLWRRQERLLRIRNEGSATARNVRVLLDENPILEHGLITGGDEEVTVLGPGAEVAFILAIAQGDPGVVHVRIEWSDDSGDGRLWESQLKVI